MSSVLEKRALKWIPLALATALVMSGCARDGFYHDRNLDYADIELGEPLMLPDTRDPRRYGDALPIPRADMLGSVDQVADVRPPQAMGVGSRMEAEFVERREIGDQQWLVVNAAPADVWPQLEGFIGSRGMNVTAVDNDRGRIETDQGQLSVQRALRSGSTEVRCEQGGQSSSRCLDALQRYFEGRSASASNSASEASWQAQRMDEEDALVFRQQDERWEVVIPHPVEPVWAEINHFIEQDFSVEGERNLLEANANEYAFLVNYMTLSERNRNPLQIVFSADVRQMSQDIRLELEDNGNETVLRAINASERAFTADDQRELLERVAGYLR
ncbi:outer membrane protein assembly factor BamC [Halomonas sp. BLK-85]